MLGSFAPFIFATTEVQKIPITILSRCQRFDFSSISDLAHGFIHFANSPQKACLPPFRAAQNITLAHDLDLDLLGSGFVHRASSVEEGWTPAGRRSTGTGA